VFRRRSFWDALLAATIEQPLQYRSYSYARRGDLYAMELVAGRGAWLEQEARRLGSGDVRTQAGTLARAVRLVYVCRR